MSAEGRRWLAYAQQNRRAATVCLKSDLFNLDTIYLPSKYPLGSVLPHFEPDAEMARRCVAIADQVLALAAKRFSQA